MSSQLYHRYWGKAQDADYHLLPYHCLDVAAVGQALLRHNPTYREHLQHLLDLDAEEFSAWFVFLLALHDSGKFADSFQNLRPDLLHRLQQRESQRDYSLRHDALGWMLWQHQLRNAFQNAGLIVPPAASASLFAAASPKPINDWIAAMTGHHGQPPKLPDDAMPRHYFAASDLAAADAFLNDLIPLLLGTARPFPTIDAERLRFASWWLAGLAVLCDWIGSNRDFFPYQSEPLALPDYWKQAVQQAEHAVQATALHPCAPAAALDLATLLHVKAEATPLQQAVSALPLAAGPQLFILEDVTGAGKTEAAVLLAHRLMQAGLGGSLYFALPTMATANTMHRRMQTVYRRLFNPEPPPALVLAHGASHIARDLLPAAPAAEPYGDHSEPAEAHGNAWLSDNRKKALLAHMGVGTIDQALLAILPSRHQSLRLLGLLDKILLVDEVHACDDYMQELLCALLRTHAAAGGSALLLSATLAQNQRDKLLNAYAQGRGGSRVTASATDAYPLLSQLSAEGLQEWPVATRAAVSRRVRVEFLTTPQAVEDTLAATLEQGRCACWLRNSVKDAMASYQDLRARHPDWNIRLFHARYTLGDRLAIEQAALQSFDKHSRAAQRRSQLLIATQVVEQSLDLDFDTLVSDLAPIDLLLQRAGRLRRHRRDAAGNPVDGADQRGDIVLHIHSPLPEETPPADWFEAFFPNAKRIYPHHGRLWLGARLLQQQGGFRMPDDARRLIEGVYGPEAELPETLLPQSSAAEGAARADASLARMNQLNIAQGYYDSARQGWWDEAKTPTRLGDPSTQIYLAKWQDDAWRPWSDAEVHPWPLSVLSMRTYWIAAEAQDAEWTPEAIEQFKTEHLPGKGRWGVLLPLRQVKEGRWEGRALNEKGEQVIVYYSDIGLHLSEH